MKSAAPSTAAETHNNTFPATAHPLAGYFHAPRFTFGLLGVILVVLLGSAAQAQNIQFTQGSTGSGLENTLSVPFRSYPGRGGTSLSISLFYSSKVWRMKHLSTPGDGSGNCGNSVVEARFAEYSTSGWNSSLGIPVLEWPENSDVYGFQGNPQSSTCGGTTTYGYRVHRLFVHIPDGSTHELRASDQPTLGYSVDQTGTFYAVDGSRLKYDASTASLWMPDGSHYEFGSTITKFIDHNGNTLNYTNSTRTWTDTMGRTLVDPLASVPSDEDDIEYTIPGFNGSTITYVFHWRHLSNALADGVSGVVPMADEYLPTPSGTPTIQGGTNAPGSNSTPSLFTSEGPDADTGTDVVGHNQTRGDNFDPIVLASIELPVGYETETTHLSYHFYYNEYAELVKTVYPTGAYETVTYDKIPPLGDLKEPYLQANRGVTERSLSADGSGSPLQTWTYEFASSGISQSQLLVTTAPDGLVTETYRYALTTPTYSHPHPKKYWPFGYEPVYNGTVFDTRTYASLGGAMLRRTLSQPDQSYSTLADRQSGVSNDLVYACRNYRPLKEVSLILDTGGDGLATTTAYTYTTADEFTTGLYLASTAEYQFVSVSSPTTVAITSISAGTLARTAETTYTSDSRYAGRYILGVATESVIKDGSGNPVSRTKTFYDEFSTYTLATYSDLVTTTFTDPGLESAYPYLPKVRADVTTIRRCLDVSSSCSSYLETHAKYDQTGNMVAAFNERGIETDTEYGIHDGTGSTNFYFHVYPTKVTSAVPDSSGVHGSDEAFVSKTIYDPVTGLVKSTTDANGLTSTISYADDSSVLDPLLRPRKVTAPNGAWTKTTYHDDLSSCSTPGTLACLYVQTQTLVDTGRITESYAFFDKLGRAMRSQSSLGSAGYLTVDTAFDAYGRAYSTSNPYTTTLGGTISTSVPKTLVTGYDALSRVTQVTLPDSTTVRTSYSGIYTTVTDQAGRSRRQKVDSLGRIVRVDEMDPSNGNSLGSVDSPYMASYYTYDTLGNLIKIQQGQGTDLQYRYFKYDALGRLTYERQPEANGTFTQSDTGLTGNSYWSRKLVYDETILGVSYQGLLTKMCDAREICSQTKYDQLNRPWEVSYPSTRQPTVTTHYDLGYDEDHHATKGKVIEILTSEVVNDTGTGWEDSIPATRLGYTFDKWGRMVGSSQDLVWDNDHYVHTYDFTYSYNVGGQMTQEEYPSHRKVNFGYDDASRLSNVNSGAGHVYVDGFTYTGQGLVSGYTLGNGATVSLGYGTNGRLQLSEIILAKNGTTLQKYQYTYGQINSSGTLETSKNNGQLAQVDSWIGTTQEYRQQYKYDCLNRLLNAKEKYGTSLGSTAYDINYEYDTFGNRYQKSSANSGNTAIVQKWVESGDYNIANNRFISTGSTPVGYDAAGNVTSDAKFRNMLFGYDANGRQNYSAQLNGSSPVTVIFDGAGQKVATKSGDYLSVSVYDAGGKLAAEYSQYGAPSTANVDYITPNYQGSTSVVTDNAGAVKSRHDYLPFGEEIGDGVGSRTTAKKFGQGDNVRQKYAGMETDDATGLNHTLWRKDDNWSGRWTSPDPYGGSMSTADPQSFNRYAYCGNDPVNHLDPLGLALRDIGVYQTDDPSQANPDWEAQKRKQLSPPPLSSEPIVIGGESTGASGSGGGDPHLASSGGDKTGWDSGSGPDWNGSESLSLPLALSQGPRSRRKRHGGRRPRHEPAAQSTPTSPQPAAPSPTCNLEVRMVRVYVGNETIPTPGFHLFFLTTDSETGTTMGFRAGPESGKLDAMGNTYNSNPEDFPDRREGSLQVVNLKIPRSCSAYNTSFWGTVRATNIAQIDYKVLSTNSNAFVYTALSRAGVKPNGLTDAVNRTAGTLGTVPGWGVMLPLP